MIYKVTVLVKDNPYTLTIYGRVMYFAWLYTVWFKPINKDRRIVTFNCLGNRQLMDTLRRVKDRVGMTKVRSVATQ
jgi:hypothetical protein